MPPVNAWPIVELRQYRLHPGTRETLIGVFDTHFVESQEACGMAVLGQFRDADDPDRFTWLRGFASMEARTAALSAFYGGPVWAEHRDIANAAMIAFDGVHLLRPATDSRREAAARAPAGALGDGRGAVLAAIRPLGKDGADSFASAAAAYIENAGGRLLALLVTERSPNTWPRLPVHEGVNVGVWLAGFPDMAALDEAHAALAAAPGMRGQAEFRRLVPTARSALTG